MNFFKVKTIAQLALILSLIMTPVQAGIPVIDGANLSQNILTTIESIAQTLKQIEEYKTQLKQYENMLQNTLAPVTEIWDDANSIMNGLYNVTNTINEFKNTYGSIDRFLNQFIDIVGYRSFPCIHNAVGCTAEDIKEFINIDVKGAKAQKLANDKLFKGLEIHQNGIKRDARQLKRLQDAASGAEGQLQALGYANQLASNQTTQLLQIRGLLISQANAWSVRTRIIMDREAREQAGSEAARKGNKFGDSPVVVW